MLVIVAEAVMALLSMSRVWMASAALAVVAMLLRGQLMTALLLAVVGAVVFAVFDGGSDLPPAPSQELAGSSPEGARPDADTQG